MLKFIKEQPELLYSKEVTRYTSMDCYYVIKAKPHNDSTLYLDQLEGGDQS